MDFSTELDELSQAFKLKVPELSPLWTKIAAWMKVLTSDYETLRKENTTLRYALADSRNTIKDMQARQRKDLEIAAEEILRRNVLDMLPILDSLTLSVLHGDGGVPVEMIRQSMLKTLEARGVYKIDSSGDYDMLKHECVKRGEGVKITREIRSGFMLNEKILRAAQVEVG